MLIFSTLMDSSSRFLTANADTVYYIVFVDLSDGPMVVETPPMALGTFDDMWFQWIVDFGLPGPDRGAGGKFLLLPPGYEGPTPEGGFYVGALAHQPCIDARPLVHGRQTIPRRRSRPSSRRSRSIPTQWADRAPASPPSSVATSPDSRPRRRRPRQTTFIEGSGLAFNTIPPNDGRFFETVHALFQDEPVGATDPEILGHLAEVGIVKGKPFAPDDRMRRILDEAADGRQRDGTSADVRRRGEEDVAFYPGSAWTNMLFGGGYLFDRPIPRSRPRASSPTRRPGARKHDLRSLFFYGYTGITPAMAMRLTGTRQPVPRRLPGLEKEFFDGAKSYTVTLPPDVPEARFWSLTLYDNQTRSMLVTPQRFPRAGSQSYPSPAAMASAGRDDHRALRSRTTCRRGRRELDPDDAG